MKVKLSTAICCPGGSFQKGAEADLTKEIAKGLIDGGYAVEIVKADAIKTEPEKTMLPTEEIKTATIKKTAKKK